MNIKPFVRVPLMILSVCSAMQLEAAGRVPAPARPRPYQIFMRQKLVFSENITEGIVLENYREIETNSVRLYTMSHEASWEKLHFAGFQEKSGEFRHAVNSLIWAAHDRNMPEVLKAHERITRSCLDCHSMFRHQQQALKYEDKSGSSASANPGSTK